MCTDAHGRFNVEEFDMPTRLGALKQVDKFDAEFFSVHGKQSDVLDPRLRNLLEVTYEAIVDAGVNPATIKGSNTGVFVAGSDSEAGFIWKRCNTKPNSYGVLGNALSMMSNRLSFTFGFTGPSYVVDTACSGSTVAFQQALHSIRTGLCDAAVVAGVQTHHDPISSYMFYHLEMTSKDGKSKVFDASADGYVRAEAAVSLYLCKKQHAKRSYCSIIHAATNNDGYKEQGITFPSEAQQEQVIRRVYDECGISPLQVDYIEAHGTGTKVGDPEEIAAVSKVFCEGRKGPLLVGSVKSNMGHPETVAGLCAISKVLLSNTKGIIPANLHYNTPNPDIPSLHDGRIQVCDKTQPFNATYVGVSSMGFGGTNVHVLLKMTPREEQPLWTPPTPIIILCSGRTQEAVQTFLEKALVHHQNHHYVSLLHEISKHETLKHPFRGFVVVESEKQEIQVEQRDTNRSNWFIFTGLGSQWAGMSKDLVKYDVFRASVHRSAETLLKNTKFDILSLLECGDPTKFEDFKNSVVSITTIQIALVDLLESIGIRPEAPRGISPIIKTSFLGKRAQNIPSICSRTSMHFWRATKSRKKLFSLPLATCI
ncbi:unnamed protein product [Allacma fusca]|uniref:Fatty acid synthase n=1 Tax=Allacma fusca TaxID=39272 RepID=A0A8J2LHE0_9HEXA|nr:unnamed protein product [Allacma fusca]